VGPTRQFGVNATYNIQLYAMIIGVFLPLPFWLWQRRYPNSWVKYINVAVAINGVAAIPPATGINFSSFFAVAVVFQYWLRKNRFAWWSKFNYITSAALDSGMLMLPVLSNCFLLKLTGLLLFTGTVVSLIFIFLTLQLPRGGVNVNWWGNTVWKSSTYFSFFSLCPQLKFIFHSCGLQRDGISANTTPWSPLEQQYPDVALQCI
jgi:hypothetical protein